MTPTLTHLKVELKETLASVGGLRAEERLSLNEQLTELLRSSQILRATPNQAQLDVFKQQLESFRRDVAHHDEHQQAYYYPHPQTQRASARQ